MYNNFAFKHLTIAFLCCFGSHFVAIVALAQDKKLALDKNTFLSYGKIPTWTGVAANWHTQEPVLYMYDTKQYVGHSTFVARALKGCTDFADFKELVRNPAKRRYVPFVLYDLRQMPVQQAANTYNWALLVQDYRYLDEDAAITDLILRLAAEMPFYVQGFTQKGIVILAKNADNKINQRLSPHIKARGHSTMTLHEMCLQTNALEQQVLNEGTAAGKLVQVNNEQEAQKLNPSDIAVYNYIPLEVPPLAGIITLHPQTPLSHTAILAKNRGTVNVYVHQLKHIPNADKLLGKMVTLKGYGNTITMTEANDNDPLRLPKPKTALTIPQASERLGGGVWSLSDLPDSLSRVENIGTKASNYAKLYRLLGSEWVREGFAIGYAPYFEVVAQQAQPYIEELLQSKKNRNREEINRSLGNIRQCIKESKVPQETITALRNLMDRHYPSSRIRLRSSTNCEDLPQFNGAGLYDSEGVNAHERNKKIAKAMLNVYASLWNERAFWERDYFGIAHQDVAMALHINEAFDNDNEFANGVLLTQATKTGIDVLVNVQADDVLVTNPTGAGEMPESFCIQASNKKIGRINSRSSRADILLGQSAERQFLIEQLANVGTQLHHHFVGKQAGYGADAEFKIVCQPDGSLRLFVKQVRLLRTGA